MKLEVIRDPISTCADATFGKLYIDGKFQCYTLEDVVRECAAPVKSWKIAGKTAIPTGMYEVIINYSNHFGKELPLLLNVPGFDGVRIHSGNTSADTEGCILVGISKNASSIGQSRIAFDRVFEQMEQAYVKGEPITITICSHDQDAD